MARFPNFAYGLGRRLRLAAYLFLTQVATNKLCTIQKGVSAFSLTPEGCYVYRKSLRQAAAPQMKINFLIR